MAFINPGIAILKTWQGIVEIALRVACVALCFIILICAGVTLSALSSAEDNASRLYNDDVSDYRSAAGWMLFVAIMGMIIESSIIILRFLNVAIVSQNFMLFGFIDIGISVVFALSLFAGATASAAYASDNADYYDVIRGSCDQRRATGDLCDDVEAVRDSEGATAAFGYFAMISFGALAVIMIVVILLGRKASNNSSASDNKEDAAQ